LPDVQDYEEAYQEVGQVLMAGKSKKPGNAYALPKPKQRVPKAKMTYNKRLLSKMRTRLKKTP